MASSSASHHHHRQQQEQEQEQEQDEFQPHSAPTVPRTQYPPFLQQHLNLQRSQSQQSQQQHHLPLQHPRRLPPLGPSSVLGSGAHSGYSVRASASASASSMPMPPRPNSLASGTAPAPVVSRTGTTGRTTPISFGQQQQQQHQQHGNASANPNERSNAAGASGVASGSALPSSTLSGPHHHHHYHHHPAGSAPASAAGQQQQQHLAGSTSAAGGQLPSSSSMCMTNGLSAGSGGAPRSTATGGGAGAHSHSQPHHHHHHPSGGGSATNSNKTPHAHHHHHHPSQQLQASTSSAAGHAHHHPMYAGSSSAGPPPPLPPSAPLPPTSLAGLASSAPGHTHAHAHGQGALNGGGAPAVGPIAGPGPGSAIAPGEGMASGSSGGTGGGGGAGEPHNLTIRSVLERGAQANADAARELGLHPDRKRGLPTVLSALEVETEGCFAEIGNIAFGLGDLDKAQRAYEDTLRRNPCHGDALRGLTKVHKEREDYLRVVEYAERALAVDPDGFGGEMWSAVGLGLLNVGALTRAYACYQQAIAKAVKKDDPHLWYGIGILYDRYGSMEHAEEAFASVLALDPHFYRKEEIYFRLGIIYKLQGKADASLECFHYIMDHPPPPLKNVDVWYQIGHALELKKDMSAAREAYEKVLRTTPDHSKVLQHLGGLYLRENTGFHDPERCIAYITASLEHDSSDPFSWYLLGRAFMQLNNYGKAYEAYQQAVYRDGKNPAYWCSIGVLYFNINQFHDALDAYTRAVRIHPFIPEIWQNLGTLYESCHDQLTDATDAYQRAVQLDPTNARLNARLNDVRNALLNGQEIMSTPPPPSDIMPDTKSWANIHFDLTGAKPVYLDQRVLSGPSLPPSPPSDAPADAGGHGPGPGAPAGAHLHSDPRIINSPTALTGGLPPHHAQYGRPGSSAGLPLSAYPANGGRRGSLTRPASSHSAAALGRGPAGYPHNGHEDRSRHPPNAAVRGPPLPPSGSMDLDPREPRRLAGGSRTAPYQERHSPPPPLHESGYRHNGSPGASPRMRGAEYEYSAHARHPYLPQGAAAAASEAEWERMRVRDRNFAAAAAERERAVRGGPPASAGAAPAGSNAPLHSPPPVHPSSATSMYRRDYPPLGAGPPPPASARRPMSPLHHPSAVRYDERGLPLERPLQSRSVSSSSRPSSHYPYDYYPGGPPPSGPPPPGSAHYYDPRSRYDPRYDPANMDPRDRELAYERELQHRRALEEEERRRREIESSRRDLSPDNPERRTASLQHQQQRGAPGAAPTGNGTGNGNGKGKGRRSLDGEPPLSTPTGSAGPSPSHPTKDRRRKVAGAVAALDNLPPRRPSPDARGRSYAPATSQPPIEDEYDDADTANVLMGLAGAAMGRGNGGQSQPVRPESPPAAAHGKRPLSAVDDYPTKKSRSGASDFHDGEMQP